MGERVRMDESGSFGSKKTRGRLRCCRGALGNPQSPPGRFEGEEGNETKFVSAEVGDGREDLGLVLLHERAIWAERDDPGSKHGLPRPAEFGAAGGRESIDLVHLKMRKLLRFNLSLLRFPQRVELAPIGFKGGSAGIRQSVLTSTSATSLNFETMR